MKRLLRYRLFLLLILISLSVSGQTPNSKDNSSLIAAAIKKFDDPRGVDPMTTYTIINDLMIIKNSCDANQKNTIDLLTSEQKNRQGDITGFIEGMSELINRQPQFKEQLLIHYFAINTTKYWIHKNNIIEASNSSLKNIFEARRSKVNRNISQAYQNRAFLFRVKNIKDSAVFYSILSTKYAKRSDSRIDLALSFHNESRIQAHFGELELAVEKELLALQIAEKFNLIYLESMFNRMICNYSLEVLNIKESYVYLKKAKLLATKLNDERSIALCEISESGILISDFKYNDAIILLEKAIKKLEKFNDVEQIGRGYEYLGQAFGKLNKDSDALTAYNKSLSLFESTGNQDEKADLYLLIGQVYLKGKSFEKAIDNIKKSIAIRDAQKEKNKIYIAFKVLSDLYFETGNKDLSYEYLKKYVDFLELNSTSKNSQKIASLTQKNSSEERERLLELQGETLEKELKEKKILQLQSDRRFYGIIFIIIILLLGGIIVTITLRQNKIKQEQRDAEMTQSLLRSQMNPHFIFNAMSVIQSYIYSNTPDIASKFLVNFSRLIRLILENSHKEFIPLEVEEEILSKYLNTQKLRFENRFNFKIKIEEELRLKRVMIPPMITQPFIENAIEHGQLNTISNGLITIYMTQKNGLLDITISDNGVGRTKANKIKKNKNHKSMAITITRERIEILNRKFKGKGSLSIKDFNLEEKTGTEVNISLPIVCENITFNHEEKSTHN
jgi:tetratricopeptide (TPR) repeat protein